MGQGRNTMNIYTKEMKVNADGTSVWTSDIRHRAVVDAVVCSSGKIPAEYSQLPLLNEGFSFELAHKLGLEGTITAYDVCLKGTRVIAVGTPKRSKKVDVPTEAWQKSIERDIKDIKMMLMCLNPEEVILDSNMKLQMIDKE